MAKKARKDPNEIIREYIGINRTTFEVETLSETRGGSLYKMLDGGQIVSHPLVGRSAKNEAVIVFGLIEIQEVTPQFSTIERRREIEAKLQAKADEMKAKKRE